MKRTITGILFTALLICLAACSTIGQKLLKSSQVMYEDICGNWYLLSNDKFGEVVNTISFNDDGTVTGDIQQVFGFDKLFWKTTYSSDDDSNYAYQPYPAKHVMKRGLIEIYYDRSNSCTIIYFFNNDNKNWNIPGIYTQSIPPLGICEIEEKCSNNNRSRYVYSKNIDELRTYTEQTLEINKKDTENWKKVKKNSVKQLIAFINEVSNTELKENATGILHELLDKKVIKYISKEDKYLARHANSMIIFENGNELCRLYEFIKLPVLLINNDSGIKPLTIQFNETGKDEFDLICTIERRDLTISFKRYKDKIVAVGIASGRTINPNNWEVALITLAGKLNNYPESINSIDVDLLENL